jgi:hypothetical protein
MSSPEQYDHTESVVVDTRPLVVWVGGEEGLLSSRIPLRFVIQSYGHVYFSCQSGKTFHTFESMGLDAEAMTTHVRDMGMRIVEADAVWKRVARFKTEYTPNFPLGDAFALATSVEKEVPLLADDEAHWTDPRRDGHDMLLLSEF